MTDNSNALSENLDINVVWMLLKEDLDVIFNTNTGHFTRDKFLNFYNVVYQYITANGSETFELNCRALYTRIEKYIENYALKIHNDSIHLIGEEMLKYYTVEWEKYKSSIKLIENLLKYFDTHYIMHAIEEGDKDVHTIYQLSLLAWKNAVLKPGDNMLAPAICQLIRKERNEEAVDTQLMYKSIDNIVQIGSELAKLVANDTRFMEGGSSESLKVYEDAIEKAFLDDTRKFYEEESKSFLSSHPFAEYMTRIEQRLSEEEVRAEVYLPKSTRDKLKSCCEKALIENHLNIFYKESLYLSTDDKSEELERMNDLLSRVNKSLEQISDYR